MSVLGYFIRRFEGKDRQSHDIIVSKAVAVNRDERLVGLHKKRIRGT